MSNTFQRKENLSIRKFVSHNASTFCSIFLTSTWHHHPSPKRLLSKKGNRIHRQSRTHTHDLYSHFNGFRFYGIGRPQLLMMARESEIRKINRKLIGLHCDCPLAVAFIAHARRRRNRSWGWSRNRSRSRLPAVASFYASFTLAVNCEKRGGGRVKAC